MTAPRKGRQPEAPFPARCARDHTNLATALKSHLKNLSTYLISTLLEQDQLPEGMPPEGFQNDGQDGQLPEGTQESASSPTGTITT